MPNIQAHEAIKCHTTLYVTLVPVEVDLCAIFQTQAYWHSVVHTKEAE